MYFCNFFLLGFKFMMVSIVFIRDWIAVWRMEKGKRAELVSFLKSVPFVEFCCVYGSTLHPNNKDKVSLCFTFFVLLNFLMPQFILVQSLCFYLLHYDFMFMQSAMVDYILGVSDPLQWHSQVWFYMISECSLLIKIDSW